MVTGAVRAVGFAAALALALQGCAAIVLPLFVTGAGLAAGTGAQYTLDGIAYRTFSTHVDRVRTATLIAFKRLDVVVKSDGATPKGYEVVGEAGDRKVYVELERLTPKATRMRITAKQGWFWRDRATAGEIIAQTERAVDDMPAATRKAK